VVSPIVRGKCFVIDGNFIGNILGGHSRGNAMIRLIRFLPFWVFSILLGALFIGSSVMAQSDDRMVRVVGWKSTTNAAQVEVMDAAWNSQGVHDLHGVTFGVKRWNTTYDFIEIAPGKWVQASALVLKMICETTDSGGDQGGKSSRPAGAYGSGNGC